MPNELLTMYLFLAIAICIKVNAGMGKQTNAKNFNKYTLITSAEQHQLKAKLFEICGGTGLSATNDRQENKTAVSIYTISDGVSLSLDVSHRFREFYIIYQAG